MMGRTICTDANMKTEVDLPRIENAVREILFAIGDNPKREGVRETPQRVARMYAEMFSGTFKDPKNEVSVIFEEENHEELVLVKDIPFYSCCEHHLVPFFGVAHVGYIPRQGQLTGLSKLARIVDTLAHRPQLQERLTTQIAETLVQTLNPLGVIVVVSAEHMCMTMRGVKKPGSKTVTSVVRGTLETNPQSRAEALDLIRMS
eukprot:GCRY01000822.1.p1 GENE.GCRY01000822.1~~GCRY01000822.1.p1  ORF type:complete len:203 (-),score=22.71 GCRY01000822.1:48-656(-)